MELLKQHRAVPEKNPNSARDIEERACENCRGQLKNKWYFQGFSRKTHVKFPWVLAFDLGVSRRCHTILQNLQGWKLVFSGISKGKVTDLKVPGGISEKYIPYPPCFDFSGTAYFNTFTTKNKPTFFPELK